MEMKLKFIKFPVSKTRIWQIKIQSTTLQTRNCNTKIVLEEIKAVVPILVKSHTN